jgi:hypothetical protein
LTLSHPYTMADAELKPLRAGETLAWRLVG